MADTEYTDLSCRYPETANAVLEYLRESLQQEEDPPNIEAYVEKSTVRIAYHDCSDRKEWDMLLLGFRDGRDTLRAENERLRKVCETALRRYDNEDRGGLASRDGLAWAMAEDLRQALKEESK